MKKIIEENKLTNNRKTGILVHPTSFPSKYGIGDLGSGAYSFIDFAEASGCKIWQVLPIGPTGYGDSPYQSFSSYAGQPLIISPEKLIEDGLINKNEIDIKNWNPNKIDYGAVIPYKFAILDKAYENFKTSNDSKLIKSYNTFCDKHKAWLDDYALFMASKDHHGGVVWNEWDEEIAFPDKKSKKKWANKLLTQVNYYKFIQFLFFKQWMDLKSYANSKGIKIVGDTPIFVAYDSSDVWTEKDLFYLDEKGYPEVVAGVPPDYFSATGQLWGNPLYKWENHKKDSYTWWTNKIKHSLELVDILRIDHFRGFDAYWTIKYGSKTAIDGVWNDGPASDLFEKIEKKLGTGLPIIAEDLGVITKSVEELRDKFNFPGMRILQFAFEGLDENPHLPHHFVKNSICYTGTHDNDTTLGWYFKLNEQGKDKLRRYLNVDGSDIVWDFIRMAIASNSDTAIIPIQDLFALGSEGRMNTPGVASDNWQFRFTYDMLNNDIKERLLYLNKLFGRLNYEEENS